jgi:cytochrome c oxidase cbb3-type subunit 3
MSNYLEILMVVIALILVVVIWLLSNVLKMMAKKVVEAAKSNKTLVTLFMLVAANLFSKTSMAQDQAVNVADTTKAANPFAYGGMSETTFWSLSSVLILELLVVFLLVYFINNLWKALHPVAAKAKTEKGASWFAKTWNVLDQKFFTKATPIEKEADILLDHDYDGIKELDNALPPWWKYGFYITIFIAVIYIFKYEIWHTGPNPTEEYTTEMNEAKAQTDAFLANMKENVDEKSVTMSDAAGIAAGKISFEKTCVACHMATGGGGVGPNLTDDYWLHGGNIKDIFKTIKYGYPDKGMQAWESTYSPVQIQQLASYIKSLKGTNPPNAKAAQGDLYKEEATAAVSDSAAKPKTDSVKAATK